MKTNVKPRQLSWIIRKICKEQEFNSQKKTFKNELNFIFKALKGLM